MARGKFNKRGGGPRFNAQSAEEIEQRNARLEELDEARAQRRAEEEDEEGGEKKEGDEKKEGEGDGKPEDNKPSAPKPETRKEREDRQKEEARAAYRRKHEAGLTEEYKKDMEKLAKVRKRREAAAAKAAAQKESEDAAEEERKKLAKIAIAEASGDKSSKKKKPEIEKLDKITIKKMKPAAMKEALKERGLEIQGNAKALTERLVKYEAER